MELGPGAGDAFDADDLDDVRARVVLPVVESLLTADELVSVDVVRRRASPVQVRDASGAYLSVLRVTFDVVDVVGADREDELLDEVWVVLEARDDERGEWLLHSPYGPGSSTLGDAALRLADQVVDWVCETRFGWAQLRVPGFTIPERDVHG